MADSSSNCIDRFIHEAQKVFADHKDPRAQAGAIARHMEVLLADPDLGDEIKKRADGRTGRIDLHVDKEYGHPDSGFCLMTSIPDPIAAGGSRERYPHDHGASWVVYGVYRRHPAAEISLGLSGERGPDEAEVGNLRSLYSDGRAGRVLSAR